MTAIWHHIHALPIPQALADRNRHVWQLDCPNPLDHAFVEACANRLSKDEKHHSQRLNHDVAMGHRFFRRAALREILGAKLACRPEEIIFACSETGRPSVEFPLCSLDFNVSHAGATSLVAVVAKGRVGVDIEASRPVDDPLAIARGIFSRRELALLEAASAARQQALFLRLWTAKEAWIKMLGCGFSVDVRQYCLATRMADDNEGRIFHLDDIPGHVAAIALDP